MFKFFLLLFSSALFAAESLPKVTLTAGLYLIQAEIANTPQSRSLGLMYRKKLEKNQGMLFIFETEQRHCMWMRNTLIPLSVAFIDKQGRIINIEDMQPKTENPHCALQTVPYALEMNQGWFQSKNIQPGSIIQGIEKINARKKPS